MSLFIGRIEDKGWDGMELVRQTANIYSLQDFKTEILVASIRNANHIGRVAQPGAGVCTCLLESIPDLLKHPLTDTGLANFLEDAGRAGRRQDLREASISYLT